ncbi:response regulator transcription factor [Ostreibacterium oceani]|uniref:Response regulator n=1 Tax=Ostreibacterium oceani TaxID=2654998 RepID=A0A6N7EZ69_9GAMM|nr:response regulator transcription factor [Ostreibacterium oceani]MPV86659.1 response regulator [Ostreibacterium oceani]
MKILLIEDDMGVANYVIKGLKESGHTVDHADNGKDGLFLAMTEKYDVMIIDRMLPEVEGLKIIQTMRASDNKTPTLILSALGDVDERVKGLKAGGDDYLIKPFAFSELLARIEVLSKRSQTEFGKTLIKNGPIEINLLSRTVKVNDQPVDLLQREYTLLEYFMKKPNQVITRSMLLENVWEYNFDPQTNIIDVHISRLRKKLDAHIDTQPIVTVRGAGYMLKIDS